MTSRLPMQHVECFHLGLLRILEVRLNRATWVVKGGVNLRAWFGSRRYSEDLDLDALGGAAQAIRAPRGPGVPSSGGCRTTPGD